MKTLILLLFTSILYAQVGINTVTPDPTGVLDINGEITVRDQPNLTVTANTMNMVVDTTGYGADSGKIKLIPLSSSSGFHDIVTINMSQPEDFQVLGLQGSVFDEEIDLGLSYTVNVPAGTTYKISVIGKMPCYQVATASTDLASYQGIGLRRNSVLLRYYSVKNRAEYNQDDTITVNAGYPNRGFSTWLHYSEIVSGPATILYELMGTVQHHGVEGGIVGSATYRFGQGTNSTEPFFGEGVGMLTIEIDQI